MITEPTYYLESVIRNKDDLEDFSGPLDLILMLLSKNKIEIRDIRISELLDQYLAYLKQMEEMDLEIASEFVQMASHLTYIKTKMLLTEEKEPTEMEILVTALEEMQAKQAFQAAREIAPELGKMSQAGLMIHTRGPLAFGDKAYSYEHTPDELLAAMANILLHGTGQVQKEEYETLKKATPKPLIYNVRDKSRQLIRILKSKGNVPLKTLFSECKSRSELVATFLSILELCSAGQIFVSGERGAYDVAGQFTLSEEELENL